MIGFEDICKDEDNIVLCKTEQKDTKGELTKTAENERGSAHALLEHPWADSYCHLGCKIYHTRCKKNLQNPLVMD